MGRYNHLERCATIASKRLMARDFRLGMWWPFRTNPHRHWRVGRRSHRAQDGHRQSDQKAPRASGGMSITLRVIAYTLYT